MILDGSTVEENVYGAATAANLEAKKVIAFLGASLQQSAQPLAQGWLSRHSADLFAIAGIALLVMLPVLGTRVDTYKAARIEKAPHAIATRDLPPYTTLQPPDIEVRNARSEKDASVLSAGFIGRYPTKLIAAGQTVTSDVLSTKKIDLGSSAILYLNLKLKAALEGRTVPISASLLFSSRGAPASGEVFSITLLNLDADEVTATIALPKARMSEAAKWIGNSEAYVFFSTR